MSVDGDALAMKIANIMSGNFLPPLPAKAKRKDKSKTHRKSSSLPDLGVPDTESENDASVNGDDISDVSSQQSFQANPMHRSASAPTFQDAEDPKSEGTQSGKVKPKVSFLAEKLQSKTSDNDDSSGLNISEEEPEVPKQNIPRVVPRNKRSAPVVNSPVQLLDAGDDFALFQSSGKVGSEKFAPNDPYTSSSAAAATPKVPNSPSVRPESAKLSSNRYLEGPTDDEINDGKDTGGPQRPSPILRGGGKVTKPVGGSGRFNPPSSTVQSVESSIDSNIGVAESFRRSQSVDDAAIPKRPSEGVPGTATPITQGRREPLSISTGSAPRNRRQSSPFAARNKYTHELLASTNSIPNGAASTFQPERLMRVAVRVRPFIADEVDNGDIRTLSKIGENLVIVNPQAFEADPDAIAAAALALDNKNWAHVFEFDHCLWSYNPETKMERYYDQEEVHITVGHEIVDSTLQGISSACFAYGHTGTGKTYSLFGNVQTLKEAKSDKYNYLKLLTDTITPDLGLIPRVFCDIISAMQERDGDGTKIYFSFVEIYNEKIRDLLSDASSPAGDNPRDNSSSFLSAGSVTSTPSSYYKPQMMTTTPQQQSSQQQQHQQHGDSLKVREHPIFGPYVENLIKVEVFTPEEVLRLIARGLSNRSTAKTHWNSHSSRSHAIATLELSPANIDQSIHIFSPPTKVLIPQVHKHIHIPNTPFSNPYHSIQKKSVSSELQHDHSSLIRVQMVDLAGSEKDSHGKEEEGSNHLSMHNSHSGIGSSSRSDASASEKDRKELKCIRKSLTTLGFIIKSLARGASAKTMPYRDTLLTYLMRESLNGTGHTTMLATISPSSHWYEETLSTLRYAEHLCLLRKTSSNAAVKPYISSLVGADKNMQGSRQHLLEDFPHIHNDLGSKKPGSVAARQLLRQTVTDPQQRIAKMIKSEERFKSPLRSRGAFDENGFPTTAAKDKNGASNAVDMHDLDDLKNSHRQLQSDYIELQIDLDAVKTDRDTLMIELKNCRDKLAAHESDKSQSKIAAIQLGRALKTAETDLNDLRGQVQRKDDNIERLMNDLADEKQARVNADNGYQSRIKEFLSRFESMKNEIAILNGSLDEANKKYRHYQEEKNELVNAMEDLKESINRLNRDKESLVRQIERMSDEADSLKKELRGMKDLKAFNEELARRLKESQSQCEALAAEKQSLLDTVHHKDSLFSIQQQKSETIIQTLNQRIIVLEKIETEYNKQQSLGIDPEEFYRMQNQLKELFTKEGKVLYSELIDTEKLTQMIREMRRKLQDFEVLQKDFDEEKSARLALESEKTSLGAALRGVEEERQQLLAQIDGLKAQNQAMNNGLNQHLQTLQSQLRNENALLREQLSAAQREASSSREELLSSREASQKEFSSLWKSIQELNELDLLKDKSIQDLIADRDRAILERDHAQNRAKMLTSQCESLQQELEEIDSDLLAAVESEESKMSVSGNYVVLHNVSDRMMHGLARRQIDKRQQQMAPPPQPPQPQTATTMSMNGANPSTSRETGQGGHVPSSNSSLSTVGGASSKAKLVGMKQSRSNSPSNSVTSHRSSLNSVSAPVAPFHPPPPPLPIQSGANKAVSPNRSNGNGNGSAARHSAIEARQSQAQTAEHTGRMLVNTTVRPIASHKQSQGQQPHQQQHHQQQQQQQQQQHQQQHQHQQQQQYVQDLNFSDDYTLSEKILERQIEELSDFLQDESKLKKSKHRNSLSGASSITDSFYSGPSVHSNGASGSRLNNRPFK